MMTLEFFSPGHGIDQSTPTSVPSSAAQDVPSTNTINNTIATCNSSETCVNSRPEDAGDSVTPHVESCGESNPPDVAAAQPPPKKKRSPFRRCSPSHSGADKVADYSSDYEEYRSKKTQSLDAEAGSGGDGDLREEVCDVFSDAELRSSDEERDGDEEGGAEPVEERGSHDPSAADRDVNEEEVPASDDGATREGGVALVTTESETAVEEREGGEAESSVALDEQQSESLFFSFLFFRRTCLS